jgi:hypothetical protein
MKEFPLSFNADILKAGLRRDFRNPRNNLSLTDLVNVKCTEYGIATYEPPIVPINLDVAGVALQWPFPQIIKGKYRTFLMLARQMAFVNEADWSWVVEDMYDLDNPANTILPNAGHYWQLIDFFDTWMLVNGASSIIYHHYDRIDDGTNGIYVKNGKFIETGTAFRGRMVLGGFDPSNFWDASWKAFFQGAATANKYEDAVVDTSMDDIGENFVMWSSIGYDLFWLFYYEKALSGRVDGAGYGTGVVPPQIYEMLARNDWGFMPMPWKGLVRQIKPMEHAFNGKGALIVYGDGGVTALVPYSDPTPTFGMVELSSVGIANTGAVSGDNSHHVFVDKSGEVWSIDSSLKLTRLGYKEYFVDVMGSDIIVSHDPHYDDFYIGNNFVTFLLTGSGMSEVKQRVTSIIYTQGYTCCLGQSSVEDPNLSIVTDEFDMQFRGIKQITWIELTGNINWEDYEVAVQYKYEDDDNFQLSDWVPINKVGVARMAIAGVSFKVLVRTTDVTDIRDMIPPDSITVKYQSSDKRFTRGVKDASQIVA